MRFAPSLSIGLLLGLANFAAWRFTARWVLSKGEVQKSFVAFLSVAKLGILGAIFWVLIEHFKVEPIGFLLGLSATIILMLAKGLK